MSNINSLEDMMTIKQSCVQREITDMYTIYYLNSPDGNGKMSKIDVFPGVQLVICDFHGGGFSSYEESSELIEVNFGISGIYRCSHTERCHIELNPGEISVSKFCSANVGFFKSNFPLGIYEGVELLINPQIASEWIKQNAGVFSIDLYEMFEKLLNGNWYQVYKANLHCKHIFSEIYLQRKEFRLKFLQLKVIEILLELNELDKTDNDYIGTKQLIKIRQIRDTIISDLDSYKNLKQLADDNNISVTHLRRLFETEYHMPIYAYLKRYRLEQAAISLTNSNLTITEIAANAGYQNPGKFSEAFKNQYGVSPLLYRKNKNTDKIVNKG